MSDVTDADDLTLTATSSHDVTTLAKGGAAGKTAVTPVVAIAVVNDSATANLGAVGSADLLDIDGKLYGDGDRDRARSRPPPKATPRPATLESASPSR